jgi:FlaA1/EpsC-like NDP-sugar epimerase
MTRYFMSIPEAVQLVLQAGALAKGGEVFTLDMGEPVRIIDLARKLIRLSGRVPDRDIAIETIGTRPGEKLAEDIIDLTEEAAPSAHPSIVVSIPPTPDRGVLRARIKELEHLCDRMERSELALLITQIAMDRGGTPLAHTRS